MISVIHVITVYLLDFLRDLNDEFGWIFNL